MAPLLALAAAACGEGPPDDHHQDQAPAVMVPGDAGTEAPFAPPDRRADLSADPRAADAVAPDTGPEALPDAGPPDAGDAPGATDVAADAGDTGAAIDGVDASDALDAGNAAPRVARVSPPDGRVGVGTISPVVVEFSQPMDVSDLSAQDLDGPCSGTVQLSTPDGSSCVGGTLDFSLNPAITFTPSRPLESLTRYVVRISAGQRSASGAGLEHGYQQPVGFRTGTQPESCRVIYTTRDRYAGTALGGIVGADALCNADPGRPATVSFAQALLADTGDRIACTAGECAAPSLQLEWVISAGACYVRRDGDFLFDSATGGILTRYPLPSSVDDGGEPFWSGLNLDWTTAPGSTCGDWTGSGDSSEAPVGLQGHSGSHGGDWISRRTASCDQAALLACVEQ